MAAGHPPSPSAYIEAAGYLFVTFFGIFAIAYYWDAGLTKIMVIRQEHCDAMVARAGLDVGTALLDRVCHLAPLHYLSDVQTPKDFADLVKALEIWNGRRYS